MQQEVSIKLKADTSEFERQMKRLGESVKERKGDEELISEDDIRGFRRVNDELEKILKNLAKVGAQLQKNATTQGQMSPPGGGGGWGHFGYGGHGGGMLGHLFRFFSLYNLYRQAETGRELIKQEEWYAANLGTRIGGYGSDFRRTRLDFTSMGRPYNMTAMETMHVADTFMSLAGTGNLRKNVSDILYASKGLGLDPNRLAQTFGMFGKMGSTDMKHFAELLAGAIKKTGMQGREEELISSVEKLTEAAYQTQLSISNQERNNMLGMLSFFGSIHPALKGEKALQMGMGLQGLFASGGGNEELLYLMGYGSRYRGIQGYWELQKRLSQGLTPENLRDLMAGLSRAFADPTLRKLWLLENGQSFGLNPEMIDQLMRPDVQQRILSGQFTQQELDALKKGAPELQKKVQDRMKSNAEQRKKWDNEKQLMQKSLGEILDDVFRGVQGWLMDHFTPEGMAAGFAGASLAMGAKGGALAKSIMKRKGGGGGGFLSGLRSGFTGFLNWVRGIGNTLSDFIPPLPIPKDQLEQFIYGSPTAMGGGGLRQVGMRYAYGWGAPNFQHAFGWGSASFRTLEAKREDLLTKEWDILRKKEDLLNKESKMQGGGQSSLGELERVVARISNTTRDMFDQYSGQTTSTLMGIMRVAFSGGAGGGGLTFTPMSYGGGGGGFLTMPLRNGFNMSADEVNAWIDKYAPKGSIMRGQGAAFVEAARRTGLDVRYLVAHAALETGWGTSRIAKDKYNFFGIGAFDSSPYGSSYRFTNPAQGIIAGAEWILQNYILKGQDTLYEMRHHGGKHEYSTDPLWDEKIAELMGKAPSATIHVKVSGSIEGLTAANNDVVARALATSVQSVDLSRVFTQGQRGVTV